MEQIRELFVG